MTHKETEGLEEIAGDGKGTSNDAFYNALEAGKAISSLIKEGDYATAASVLAGSAFPSSLDKAPYHAELAAGYASRRDSAHESNDTSREVLAGIVEHHRKQSGYFGSSKE